MAKNSTAENIMMIAQMKTDDGKQFLLLGLSRENVNRLIAGQTIAITAEKHGDAIPKNMTIALMFGETELDMKRELESYGVVTKETKVSVDPRLK